MSRFSTGWAALKWQKALAWLVAHPIRAALFAGGIIVMLAATLITISTLKHRGANHQEPLDDHQASVCGRLLHVQTAAKQQKSVGSPEYRNALAAIFEELLHEKAGAQELTALLALATDCSARLATTKPELARNDAAWLVAIETHIKRVQWPEVLTEPPADVGVREALARSIAANPGLPMGLPTDASLRNAWLRFAAQAEPPLEKMIALFRGQTPESLFSLYQRLQAAAPEAPPLGSLYSELGLLPQAILVRDVTKGEAPLIPFVGVIGGRNCAVASPGWAAAPPFPKLTERSCTGLVPQRLPQGDLVLLAVNPAPARKAERAWLPVVLSDDKQVLFSPSSVKRALITAFVTAGHPSDLNGHAFNDSLTATDHPDSAAGDPFYLNSIERKVSHVEALVFSNERVLHRLASCPRPSAKRCQELLADHGDDRCEFSSLRCFESKLGLQVRLGEAVRKHHEVCFKELGEKNDCADQATAYSLFVDHKAGSNAEWVEGPLWPKPRQ